MSDDDVDCMACIANGEMPETWSVPGGPRNIGYGQDEHGVSHAFIAGKGTWHAGWWKCDFHRVDWGKYAWMRNLHPGWDL